MRQTSTDTEVLAFGKEVLQSTSLVLVASFTLAFLFNLVGAWLLFLISFSSLRAFYGGYHASTAFYCLICSLAMELGVLLCLTYHCLDLFNQRTLSFILILNCLFIIITSPIEAINKPLNPKTFARCKCISYVLLGLNLLMYLICSYPLEASYYADILFLSIFSITWLGVFGLIKQRYAKS